MFASVAGTRYSVRVLEPTVATTVVGEGPKYVNVKMSVGDKLRFGVSKTMVASVLVPVGNITRLVVVEPSYPAVNVSRPVGPVKVATVAGVRTTGREFVPEVTVNEVGEGPKYGNVTTPVGGR